METSLRERLDTPTDAAGLAAFRILFGAVVLFSTMRFWANGWIESLWLDPGFHFTWAGFDWVEPLPGVGMYLVEAALIVAALAFTVGLYTRVAAAAMFVLFTYGELIDKATYLNHYYLVSLLAFLCIWLPVGAAFSLDARRNGEQQVPLGVYVILRSQIAVVYLFAGIAKLSHDWLVLGEPLRTWLQAHHDLPLIGPILDTPEAALVMSWAGMLHDLFIIPALLYAKTRTVAFIAAVVFHLAIWLLFPVGVFSWVMLAAITVTFAPDWPRKLPRIPRASPSPPPASRTRTLTLTLASLYLAAQLLIPLRHLFYEGDVNWTEQGFRFAWRVMLIEKTGTVDFHVIADGRRVDVLRIDDLTPLQLKQMSTQPDMIHDYAHHLADKFHNQGFANVEVRADAWVALNGRPAQRIIDPDADLAATPRGPWSKPWIISRTP